MPEEHNTRRGCNNCDDCKGFPTDVQTALRTNPYVFTVKDIIEAVKQLEAKNAVMKCSVCDAEFYAFDREGRPVTDLISLTCGAHTEH